MERWRGRVAVVTGASAGIGAAVAYQLLDAGVDVVALARRKELIPAAVDAAREAAKARGHVSSGDSLTTPGKLHCLKCDISREQDVVTAFQWVKNNTSGVDVLVNNAGVVRTSKLAETNTEDWETIWNVNVMGLSICTREAVQQMKERGADDGHVVNIGSAVGHTPPPSTPGWAMYTASKHAVRVLTEGLRKELVADKSRIRVSEVSPGLVQTDIFNAVPDLDQNLLWGTPHLAPEAVADAVLYAVAAPPHVQIHEIIVKATGEIL